MAQHLQPRHLSGQQSNSRGQKQSASSYSGGRRVASEEQSYRRSSAYDEEVTPRRRAVSDEEPAPRRRTVSSDEETEPRRRAVPSDEETAPRRRTVSSDEEVTPRRRTVPSDEEAAPRRRTVSSDEEPAPRRRTVSDEEPAPRRRTVSSEEEAAPRRRAVSDEERAYRRRAAYEDEPAPRRRAADQRDDYDRRPAQSRQGAPARRQVYDDYIDTTDHSPGGGSLAIVAILKVLITLALAALFAGFALLLRGTGMLPDTFFIAACAALGVLLIVILSLLWFSKKSAPLYTGIVLALACSAGLMFGYRTLSTTVGTLHNITGANTAVSHVGVYVLQDDAAQSLEEVSQYTVGIVSVMGRESVDETINQLNANLSTPIQPVEYNSIGELVDALRAGSVQAMVVGQAQLEALQDSAGYEDLTAQIREVTQVRVEREVQNEVQTAAVPAESNAITVYISGIDSREGMVAESRTDVNIIATINFDTHQVLMVSTPRDYYIPLSVSNGELDKLTHAGLYGIDEAEKTLEMLYDIDIDYYFRVCFDGFEQIIDALGGVTVESDAEFWDYTDTYFFTEGTNELNGAEALAFARERKAFYDGDRVRGRHQMEVISSLANKVLSTDMLANYSSVMEAVEGSFETDMTYDMVAELVQKQLSEGGQWDFATYSVNGTENWEATCYSLPGTRYVMEPDMSTVDIAKDLMARVRAGEVVDPPAS